MKKLILLLLLIPLVSCESNETKENVYSFGEDTWLRIFSDENGEFQKFDFTNNKDLQSIPFFEINNSIVKEGSYHYSSWKKELKKNYFYKSTYFFADDKNTILVNKYLFDNDSMQSTTKLKWKSYDSIYGTLISFKENGKERVTNPDGITDLILLRIPKYSSSKARDILAKKKNDLDLQLITQKQYDSIKNKLSRYITD